MADEREKLSDEELRELFPDYEPDYARRLFRMGAWMTDNDLIGQVKRGALTNEQFVAQTHDYIEANFTEDEKRKMDEMAEQAWGAPKA